MMMMHQHEQLLLLAHMCVYTCLNRLFCGKQAAIDAFHTPTCADQNIRAKADVILPFILVRMSKTKGTLRAP